LLEEFILPLQHRRIVHYIYGVGTHQDVNTNECWITHSKQNTDP